MLPCQYLAHALDLYEVLSKTRADYRQVVFKPKGSYWLFTSPKVGAHSGWPPGSRATPVQPSQPLVRCASRPFFPEDMPQVNLQEIVYYSEK